MNASIKKMTYCTQCAHHKVMPDPNPDNQFTTDDVAILCTKTKQKPNLNSNDEIEKQDCRVVARHRSPYHLVNGFQTEIPSWCPEREGLVKENTSPNELYIFGEKGLSGQEEKVLILNMKTSMRIGTYTFKAQELKKLVTFIQENIK